MWDTALYISALILGCIFAAIGLTVLAVLAGTICGALYVRSLLHTRPRPLH